MCDDQVCSFTEDEIRKIAKEACVNQETTEFCIKMIRETSFCCDNERLKKILATIHSATYKKDRGCPLSIYFPRSYFS